MLRFFGFSFLFLGCTGEEKEEEVEDRSRHEEVCEKWNVEQDYLAEGSWNGSVADCDAGTISTEGIENALRQINFHRWLADLSSVESSADKNQAAQECALIMHANNSLSHFPDTSWSCYSELGAEGAGSSNIAWGAGVGAVHSYMIDAGNETTIGHRRWILSNSLGPVGLGSTSAFSCMHVIGGGGTENKDWTAWPPVGPVPIDIFEYPWNDGLNETGWTVQSDSIDLSGASVSITRDDGEELSVEVVVLQAFYGSEFAINLLPVGWRAEVGYHYQVQLSNISTEIDYTVEVVDCDEDED